MNDLRVVLLYSAIMAAFCYLLAELLAALGL